MIDQEKVQEAYNKCISILDGNFSREEIITVLSKLTTNTGLAIYYKIENPEEKVPAKINAEQAEELYWNNPSTGSTLIKLGFDIHKILLEKG